MFVQPQTVWPLLREGAIMLSTGYISCQFSVFPFNEGCIWRTVKIPAPYIRLQDYLSVIVPSCLLIFNVSIMLFYENSITNLNRLMKNRLEFFYGKHL